MYDGDLSSEVSSSDLLLIEGRRNETAAAPTVTFAMRTVVNATNAINVGDQVDGVIDTPGQIKTYTFTLAAAARLHFDRSEERGGGKERRSRWSPSHYK